MTGEIINSDELMDMIFEDAEELRENDLTIHWTLAALNQFYKDLEGEGLFIEELPNAVQKLEFHLLTNISIRLFEITGLDTSNFSESDEIDEAELEFYEELIEHIIEYTLDDHIIEYQDANMILSNLDKLNLQRVQTILITNKFRTIKA